MFYAREFVYNGVSSEMYDLMIYDLGNKGQSDVSFGNQASIVETRTTGRIQPIHYGVNYHSQPLEFPIVFGAERAMDRYELQDISMWLSGSQEYGWLSICQPDMEDIQYHCLFTDIKPLSIGNLPVAFEATIRCDCPYAYGYPFEKTYSISGETPILFRNEGTAREYLRPSLEFTPASGTSSISIVNNSDNGYEFKISNLPSGCVVEVDGINGIIRDTSTYHYNLLDGFNAQFFRLVQGDNRLVITGDGTLKITGRFLYNVAA